MALTPQEGRTGQIGGEEELASPSTLHSNSMFSHLQRKGHMEPSFLCSRETMGC